MPKVSDLPAANAPTGAELLPLVQNGSTRKMTLAKVLSPALQTWQANTAITAGAIRLSPDGSVVKAKADGTTDATYDATKFDVIIPSGASLAAAYVTQAVASAQSFVNPSLMKATRPVDGTYATTAGYAALGDGGGAMYRYAASSTAADDGASVLVPTTGSGAGRWLLVPGDALNVKWFGAKGDGVTDDTAKITLARNVAGTGGALYFPPATYIVDGLQQTVSGQSWTLHPQATLKLKPSSSTLLSLKVTAVAGFRLTGGTIDGNIAQNTGGDHFQIKGSTDVTIRDVTIRNAVDIGVIVSSSQRVSIRGNRFFGCANCAVLIDYDSTYPTPSADIEVVDNLIDFRGLNNTGGIVSRGTSANLNRRITISGNRMMTTKPTASDNSGAIFYGYTVGGVCANNVLVGGGIPISIEAGAAFITVASNSVNGFYNYGIEFAQGAVDCAAIGNVVDGTGSVSWCISISAGADRIQVSGGSLFTDTGSSLIQITDSSTGDVTITGVAMRKTSSGGAHIVRNSGTGRLTVSSSTFIGSGTTSSGVKFLGGGTDISITGNRFKGFTTAAVEFSGTATYDYASVSGNTAPSGSAMTAVTGATLGSNVVIANNIPGPKYYRFNVTALRGTSETAMQYAEFQLLDSSGNTITGAAVTAPGATFNTGEAPAQAVDGNLGTKFYTPSGAKPLVLAFNADIHPTAYRVGTANDSSSRDPITWTIDVSSDGKTWTTLDTQTSYATPTARQAYTPNIAMTAS